MFPYIPDHSKSSAPKITQELSSTFLNKLLIPLLIDGFESTMNLLTTSSIEVNKLKSILEKLKKLTNLENLSVVELKELRNELKSTHNEVSKIINNVSSHPMNKVRILPYHSLAYKLLKLIDKLDFKILKSEESIFFIDSIEYPTPLAEYLRKKRQN